MDPAVDGAARRLTPWILAGLVPVAFLAVFFVLPVATIVGMGFEPGAVADVARDGRLRSIAWFTLWQAALSTLLTLVAGLPGAYVLTRFEFPGRRFLRAAVTVPFVLPSIVVGTAFLALIGPGAPLAGLGLTGTVWPILLAHVFFNYAVVVRTVGGLWAHLDPRQEEAARVLGASRWRAFAEVTLRQLAPALAAAGAIIFLFTFTSFGVVLLLGGPHRSTLEVEIWRQTAQLLDLRTAAALSVLQLVAITSLLLAQARWVERRSHAQRLAPARELARRPRRAEWVAVVATLAPAVALLGAPLAVLVARSFATPGGVGLGFYRSLDAVASRSGLFVPPLQALTNSLRFAVIATVVALAVGLPAAVVVARRPGRAGRALDALVMLPLGTSAVTVGFGFLVALDEPPLDLRTSPLLIPLAHALVAVPFVVRVVVPVLRALDPRVREAAAVLGAGPARVWREIDLPIVGRAALVAAGFSFAISLGEFGATLFIARPEAPTLPVAVFRLLSQPGVQNAGQAMAMCTILMVVTAAVVLAVDRFRAGDVGEF